MSKHKGKKMSGPRYSILEELLVERETQDERFGEQNHGDGTGGLYAIQEAIMARSACDRAFRDGFGTWADILKEEFHEAMAETAPLALRRELIQVAAVAVAWVECIDRRLAEISDVRHEPVAAEALS